MRRLPTYCAALSVPSPLDPHTSRVRRLARRSARPLVLAALGAVFCAGPAAASPVIHPSPHIASEIVVGATNTSTQATAREAVGRTIGAITATSSDADVASAAIVDAEGTGGRTRGFRVAVTGLESGGPFDVTLTVQGAGLGGGQSEEVSLNGLMVIPAAPELTAVEGSSAGEIDLTWTDPGDDGIGGYEVRSLRARPALRTIARGPRRRAPPAIP